MAISIAPSAFRYPGSKEKISWDIFKCFPDRIQFANLCGGFSSYCEPFIGCGAMAMKVLPSLPASTRVVFGDKDIGIVSLWRSVYKNPKGLTALLSTFTPSVDEFYRLKELDGTADADELTIGFRKFVLHQMSFSGLGAKAGGPIGGAKQRSDYAVDCRFRPERHAKAIAIQQNLLRKFKSFEVVHGDFETAMSRVDDGGFTYLDPPYYLQGGALYVHDMTDADHERLAGYLRSARFDWVLSYDDHQRIHALYSGWSDIKTFQMTATIDSKKGSGARRKNNELVITPKAKP